MDPDEIGISFTGLRPGERLHESLFYEAERAERTRHEGILRVAAREGPTGASGLPQLVADLESAIRDGDERAVRELLRLEPLTGRVPGPVTAG
jgi:FlaA1/EpsC-like NDP-sugar epimerase